MSLATAHWDDAPTGSPKFCSECGAALSAGARFCHRCGTTVHPEPALDRASTVRMAWALPWGMAALALLVIVAVLAAREGSNTATVEPTNPAVGRPPDLAAITPSERANRLYVRVMEYAAAGKADSVARFAPMVLAAHQMLPQPSADERYHYGRVAEVVGSREIAAAQADTLLRDRPTSLLGLLLAARVARVNQKNALARSFDNRLLVALASELATRNQDYENHRAEIDQAVADARPQGRRSP